MIFGNGGYRGRWHLCPWQWRPAGCSCRASIASSATSPGRPWPGRCRPIHGRPAADPAGTSLPDTGPMRRIPRRDPDKREPNKMFWRIFEGFLKDFWRIFVEFSGFLQLKNSFLGLDWIISGFFGGFLGNFWDFWDFYWIYNDFIRKSKDF